jgi:hypothetical protein
MGLSPRLLRPANNAFTPKSISGLALWLDASDASTLFQNSDGTVPATATSDPVGYWGDKSGNARHATQSTAGNRPTVSAASLNSRGTVAFAGSLSHRLGATVPGTDAQLYTVLVVARNATSASGVLMGERGGNFTNALHFQTSAGNRLTMYIQRAEPLYGTHGGAATLYGYSKDSTTLFRGYQNGAKVIDSDGAVVTGLNLGNLLRNIGSSTSGASAFTGNIAELIAYPSSLSDADRRRVERYLATKWGIGLAPQVSNADAQDWVNRVYANGGTVSASTAAAVNAFCDAIDYGVSGASIRDRFYRLNLFCGGTSGTAIGLNSCLVPLYRGQSLSGTQYGGTADTNVSSLFVGANYNETGAASGGLEANGFKYLNTGFLTNILSDGNRHLAAYEITRSESGSYKYYLGSEYAAGGGNGQFILGYQNFATSRAFGFGAYGIILQSPTTTAGGFWMGVNTFPGTGIIYRNGSQDSTGTTAPSTPEATNIYVFAGNRSGTGAAGFVGRLGGYSIGLSMTAAQASAYNTAMQTFQTALNRSA